jgi:hypothetical protein
VNDQAAAAVLAVLILGAVYGVCWLMQKGAEKLDD